MPAQPQVQPVPEALVYEMHEGRPIYYQGYRDVLAGHKTQEKVMSDSSLQAWLKFERILFPAAAAAHHLHMAGISAATNIVPANGHRHLIEYHAAVAP